MSFSDQRYGIGWQLNAITHLSNKANRFIKNSVLTLYFMKNQRVDLIDRLSLI